MKGKNAQIRSRTRKSHWENVFELKKSNEFSWYQEVPEDSLRLIHDLGISPNANLIDIGGGDSALIDFLLNGGYQNVTLLDISQNAINRTLARLGDKANLINWIVSDILDYIPSKKFDLWHDRAVFHFLTNPTDISKYMDLASTYIKNGGYLILGTFSENGPLKCSGLTVTRYSEEQLGHLWEESFDKVKCFKKVHLTPSNSEQNFLFCLFKRK